MAEALGIDPAYVMGWVDVSDKLHATLDPLFSPDTPAAKQLREIGEGLTGTTISSPEARELLDIYYDLTIITPALWWTVKRTCERQGNGRISIISSKYNNICFIY